MAAGMADQWLRTESTQLVSVLRGGRVDVSLVTCFERRLPALWQMDASLGGGGVRGMVDAELRL
ncbi:MAG: transcriptional regulator, partial [Pseudonocardiales bacterium]|nr:transcriptional regulator [Pseudonocardiales bacterium]